jgi:hypothetical protein
LLGLDWADLSNQATFEVLPCSFYPDLLVGINDGRLVRKTLSFSKELLLLKAASALEDALYNFTRPVKTLRVELANHSKQARWQQRTPAMAAGLTDHIWTLKELLHLVLVPLTTNT